MNKNPALPGFGRSQGAAGFFILGKFYRNYGVFFVWRLGRCVGEISRKGAKAQSFIFLLLFSVFLFANCQSENPQVSSGLQTREVTDDLGRTVALTASVERAVSLAPNLTEIVFAVGAGDKLVGVTSFCNYPPEARKITKIGDTMNPNLEAIIAQKPQVVFVSTDSQIENFTRRMQEQNIAVFVTDAKNLEGVLRNIEQIGDVLGKKEQAENLTVGLQKRIAAVESKVKGAEPVKVFVQISNSPIYTIGKDSFITDLVRRAGGVSLTENIPTAYPNLSKETALAFEPEAIILSESPDNQEPNEAFKNSPAVKNGRIYKISADLLSRPSPRIVDALEEMARALNPENFE